MLHRLLDVIACQPVCTVRFQQATASDLGEVYQVLANSTVKWAVSCSTQLARLVKVFVSPTVHSLIGCHAQTHDLKLSTIITNLSNKSIPLPALNKQLLIPLLTNSVVTELKGLTPLILSLPPDTNLSQFKPVHILTIYFITIHV